MAARRELGFIGAGNIATALGRGVVAAGVVRPEDLLAADPDPQRRRAFEAETGASTTNSNAAACECRTVVLAVKPQVMPDVLAEVGPLFDSDALVISVAAGVPTARIEAAASPSLRVIRAMPNTPMLVGQGAVALCRGTHATDADLAYARRLFESCALVLEVDEESMHAVTALSGSGPAYLFYLAEIMEHAGTEMGLPEATSVELTARTLLGAAQMLAETGESAAELRRKVTSPGGTTEAALRSMEQAAVAESIVRAIQAACARSRELAGDSGPVPPLRGPAA